MLQRDGCAGYGGALSVYAGLSAALQLLSVSFFSIALHNNAFANCGVSGDVVGGNSYGGGVSLYIGSYSSVLSSNGDAVAAVGDTVVRNVSVTLDSTTFESCSATRNGRTTFGANVYGGSFSFYVGAYAWSRSDSRGNSSSTCGETDVSGVTVRVLNASSVRSSASTTTIGGNSRAANSYGGSMSVLHIGGYAWSRSNAVSSNSSSMCEATTASGVSVHVSDSGCSNCSALTTSSSQSLGANSYGGSMSVLYVGAYAWSWSAAASSSSSSMCEATTASGVSVHVSDSGCSNCSALSASGTSSFGANSYGGSMSGLYVGADAWSWSDAASSNSRSMCEATTASGVSVRVSDSGCSNCSALSTNSRDSFGANSYGGSISASYIGSLSYSFASGEFRFSSSSGSESTRVHRLSVTITNCTIADTQAMSGECRSSHTIHL